MTRNDCRLGSNVVSIEDYREMKEQYERKEHNTRILMGVLAGFFAVLLVFIFDLNIKAFELRQEIQDLRNQLEEMQAETATVDKDTINVDTGTYLIQSI